jgi:pimeloyl-ACP methyl ester carboxylesterase
MSKNLKFLSLLFAITALLLASASLVVAQEKFAKLDTTKIHYTSEGKGSEALVLVHGWGSNLDFWRAQVPELAKRARVIALDLPGHGKSDKPETTYSMDYFAAARP